jgi:hypothetical protein
MKRIFAVFVLAATLASTQAAVTEFDLFGKAGAGLLSGNENGTIVTTPNPVGSGGELGTGIFFDDATRLLTINVGWGSGNGFLNLSGNATLGHIHGPTTSGGTGSFTQNASPKYDLGGLAGFNASANNGGFNGGVTIDAGDVAALFNGQFYLNFHTSQNPGGEIRGNLVPVPEPSTYALLGLGAGGLLCWMRRRTR